MNSTPQPSRLERWHDRLTQSKYWTVSLAVHAVLIAALSTFVLIKNSPTEDFAFISETPSGGDLPPQRLVPDEPGPVTDLPTRSPEAPKPANLPPAASRFDHAVVLTDGPSSLPPVTIGIPMPPVDVPKIGAAPAHVPDVMGNRFQHGSDGFITMRGNPGPGRQPTKETETAVVRGLRWLRDHQNKDGSWGERNKGAMTGLALLSFLGHGETDKSPEYGVAVAKAIQWVIDEGTKHEGRLSMTGADWGPGNGGVYEHGILTYALGEYFTLTRNERVQELLGQAVKYIIDGQGPDGGWMYRYDKTQSDTSVSGWQVQALKAAHLTKLGFPGIDAALDRAMKNFERVRGEQGGYGYRTPGDRYSLSGVGVACELFWTGKRTSDLRKGVKFILDHAKQEPVQYTHEKADLYAWYYHTQAMLMFGGGVWQEWEPQFREMAVKSQSADGSWPVMRAAGHGNLQNDANLTGAVYRTTLNILMLEAYYRYLPLNQANTPGDALRFAVR